jgi:glycosyltransferase involved in cell wall biosynthesis
MRIVLDMQGAQTTGSRNRGIGRYTFSLAQAIVRNRGNHEVFLALNGLFSDTIEPIRVAFDGLLPQENIRVWHTPGPVRECQPGNNWRRYTAELLYESFLANLRPDVVLVSSLFEGLNDDAVTSIGTLSCTVPTVVILYDLIPLIYRQLYMGNPVVEAWYENKLNHLRRADLLLAISESSRQDAIRYLGFPSEVCINISAAATQQFQPQQIDCEQERDIRQRYGLHHPFVMYTGGIDHRKNIEGLIRAYAKLPRSLRADHQLVIVCSIEIHSRSALKMLAKEQGMEENELVFTGFVPEEDLIALYNLCKVFVFPSWYEGFGLPALEAMLSGSAVIAANTSSLPEVIGREDALFDPHSDDAIAAKLEQVLTDEDFRNELKRHAIEQAKRFSWDESARRAINAFETLHAKKNCQPITISPSQRPKLAYISPLPPEKSGISDYSAELLPELARHYDIEVVVNQKDVTDTWIKNNLPVRSVEWFRAHADQYHRIVYHFGNSSFHQHMFALLKEVPGVVVLHDFFLSGVVAHMEHSGYKPHFWTKTIYQSHGYEAVQQRFQALDKSEVIWRYPCNLAVLQNALGIIVHSEFSRDLAEKWYGQHAARDWAVIPHLRVPALDIDRSKARRQLNLNNDDFLVCSFGMLGPTKLNHRLLEAWLVSPLSRNERCVLVFVGQNHGGEYGVQLLKTIKKSGLERRIRITGWADAATFRQYLAAADMAVQLRTLSRGETSGTVLDCMNYGLATIVNAHGGLAELSKDAVWMLPDEFTNDELVNALETLWKDKDLRARLGSRAQEIIQTRHDPARCAEQYAQTIEAIYQRAQTGPYALINAIAAVDALPANDLTLKQIATSIAISFPPKIVQRQLLVDISELVQRDVKSDIQRVVCSILKELLDHPPNGYRVEPVYATMNQGYRYARRFTLRFLDCPETTVIDEPIEYSPGDLFLGLDLQPHVVPVHRPFYQQLRNNGVQVWFLVYDLLPITLSHAFGAGAKNDHHGWLNVVVESDGAICISRSVADELAEWYKSYGIVCHRPFKIHWFHIGADISASLPTTGLPADAEKVLTTLSSSPSFLMVGTIEPRKSHAQVLAAFELLWAQGMNVNLVIVGKQGWLVETFVERLRHHKELGQRLFWLEGISDEYLEKVYAASTCLLMASEGEGFGLPLIEAAQHKLPILARDIPVFREVAGEHAFYFSGLEPEALAKAVKEWLELYKEGRHPKSDAMPWLTWRESTQWLLDVLFKRN